MNAKIEVRNETHAGRAVWSEMVECGWFDGTDAKEQAEAMILKLKTGTAFVGRDADNGEFRVITWN